MIASVTTVAAEARASAVAHPDVILTLDGGSFGQCTVIVDVVASQNSQLKELEQN